MVALAAGFARAGHNVRLVAHEMYRSILGNAQIELHSPPANNPRDVHAEDQKRRPGRNPVSLWKFISRQIDASTELAGFVNACKGADAIIINPPAGATENIAESLNIPCFVASVNPRWPTRSFPCPIGPLPIHRIRFGGSWNLFTHVAVYQLFEYARRGWVNRWRVETLGLKPLPMLSPHVTGVRPRRATLFGFSERVIPRPRDWPKMLHVTGYWFWDGPSNWQPANDLIHFLDDGPPPIYVGFGSTIVSDSCLWNSIIAAIQRVRCRVILGIGWSQLGPLKLPGNIFAVDSVPFAWLFHRVAAVVHHGGMGTSADALRCGVPCVNIPSSGEQNFWSARMERLGVSPPPIAIRRLKPTDLANAIGRSLNDRRMRARARMLSMALRQEDGVSKAVEVFHSYFRNSDASPRPRL